MIEVKYLALSFCIGSSGNVLFNLPRLQHSHHKARKTKATLRPSWFKTHRKSTPIMVGHKLTGMSVLPEAAAMAKGLRDQKVLRCWGVFCWSSLRKKGRKGLRRKGTATLEGNATLASFLPSPCVTRDQRKFGSLIRQLLLNASRAVTGIFRWFWLIYFSPEFWTIPTHTCRLGLSQQILHWADCHFLELQLPE